MSIDKRLAELERKAFCCTIPDFEAFRTQWATMDDLSKSLYIMLAENHDNVDGNATEEKFFATIAAYLRRMGLVREGTPSLREIAAQL